MAKDDNKQGNSLLGSIVSELKQLNRATVKDKLRDAEALKRSEKLAAGIEQQTETGTVQLSNSQDFQRRFLAGQARTEFNAQIKERPSKLYAQLEGNISLGLMKVNSDALVQNQSKIKGILKGIAGNQGILGSEPTFSGPTNPEETNTADAVPIAHSHDNILLTSIGESNSLIKVNTDALVQSQSKIKNINHQILDFMKVRAKESDLQFNTSARDAEENRREMINLANNRGGAGGSGFGGGTAGGEDGESAGGIFKWILGNKGIATALTASGFALAMKSRFAKIAGKLFPKSKYGFVGPKQLRNPRLWPLILAAGVATAFIQAGDDVLSDPGDGQTGNGPDNQADAGVDIGGSSMVDNAITAAIWAPLLVKGAMKTRIGLGMKKVLTKMYGSAAAGTAKNSIWKRMIASVGWKTVGSRFAMLFGPWGMAAYIAWGIIDWRMGVVAEQQLQAEADLEEFNRVKDDTMLEPSLTGITLGEYNAPKADANDDGITKPGEERSLKKRKQDMRAKVVAMLKTTKGNAEFRNRQIQMLLDPENPTGWTKGEINSMIHAADGTSPKKDFHSKWGQGTRIGTGKDSKVIYPWDPSGKSGDNTLGLIHNAAKRSEALHLENGTTPITFDQMVKNLQLKEKGQLQLIGGAPGAPGGTMIKTGDTTIINNETIFINAPKENNHKRKHVKDR